MAIHLTRHAKTHVAKLISCKLELVGQGYNTAPVNSSSQHAIGDSHTDKLSTTESKKGYKHTPKEKPAHGRTETPVEGERKFKHGELNRELLLKLFWPEESLVCDDESGKVLTSVPAWATMPLGTLEKLEADSPQKDKRKMVLAPVRGQLHELLVLKVKLPTKVK
jgi:hypothetical protein